MAPSFLKIDIEGYEPRMISGAHKLIMDNLPIIMMEVSPKLWGKALTSDWEATLNFLMKVYGSALICDGDAVSEFSTLNFTKFAHAIEISSLVCLPSIKLNGDFKRNYFSRPFLTGISSCYLVLFGKK